MFCVDDFSVATNNNTQAVKEYEKDGQSSIYDAREYGEQTYLGKSKGFFFCPRISELFGLNIIGINFNAFLGNPKVQS
jgi:hypothetical protein